MPGSASDSVIDQVREAADIVEVVQGYFPLTKAGKDFRARCPFHEDKDPSFYVVPDKQIYHCFGCGAGGNVFNFLMQYENLTFRDSLEMLARRYGVEFPRRGARDSSEAELTYRINALATKVYRAALLNTKEGHEGPRVPAREGHIRRNGEGLPHGLLPLGRRHLVGQAQKSGLKPPNSSSWGARVVLGERSERPLPRAADLPHTQPHGQEDTRVRREGAGRLAAQVHQLAGDGHIQEGPDPLRPPQGPARVGPPAWPSSWRAISTSSPCT